MTDIPYFLGIDTSTTICSVSVFDQDGILSVEEDHSPNSHSAVITHLISASLKKASIEMSALNGVIIADGPGSYTGLRIGASAAKGLCYVLEIPLMSESNLRALCNESRHQAPDCAYHISAIDARRKDIYLCITDNEGKTVLAPHLATLDEKFQEYLKNLGSEYLLSGNGGQKMCEILDLSTAVNSDILNSAANLRHSAVQLFDSQSFAGKMFFEPNYMQAPKIIPSKKLLL